MGKPTIKYYKWQFSIAMLNYQRLLTVALHLCKDMLKTTAKAVQKKALLGWTVLILTGRRAKMTHRHSLQPLFFGLANQKKLHFHSTKWSKKGTPWNCHEEGKKDWSAPKPHVWWTLYQRCFSQMSTPPRAVSGRAGCLCSCLRVCANDCKCSIYIYIYHCHIYIINIYIWHSSTFKFMSYIM